MVKVCPVLNGLDFESCLNSRLNLVKHLNGIQILDQFANGKNGCFYQTLIVTLYYCVEAKLCKIKCVNKINKVLFILNHTGTKVNKTELTRPTLEGPPGNTQTLHLLAVQHLDSRQCFTWSVCVASLSFMLATCSDIRLS